MDVQSGSLQLLKIDSTHESFVLQEFVNLRLKKNIFICGIISVFI